MAAHFDNLDDVSGKFTGTICYFEKKPVVVKSCFYDPDNGKEFMLTVVGANGRSKQIKLKDPAFNYRDFNIGYANSGLNAVWWYRRALKQYRQGLKKDQLYWKSSIPGVMPDKNFDFYRPYIKMLENEYPSIKECRDYLHSGLSNIIAFHKDFAMSWDNIHEHYMIEYRGKLIGMSLTPDFDKFKLVPEANHLIEALHEAV